MDGIWGWFDYTQLYRPWKIGQFRFLLTHEIHEEIDEKYIGESHSIDLISSDPHKSSWRSRDLFGKLAQKWSERLLSLQKSENFLCCWTYRKDLTIKWKHELVQNMYKTWTLCYRRRYSVRTHALDGPSNRHYVPLYHPHAALPSSKTTSSSPLPHLSPLPCLCSVL